MKAYSVFIGLWILINFINISEGSPPSEKRILNEGDNMTLICSTVRDPDIISWIRRSHILTQNGTEYIAEAGKSFPNGKIFKEFRDDSRISVFFINDSIEDGSVNYTLYISNISRQDSAEYACYSTTDSTGEYISLYEIHVVGCNCSIDTNVHCDILSFNIPIEGSVNIIFNGSMVRVVLIENRFKFSHDHLITLAQEQYIFVSLDYDYFRSNIRCILPQQSYPLSTRKTTTIPISSRRPTSVEGTKIITSRTNKPPPTDKFTDTTTHMYMESTVPATIHSPFSQSSSPTFSLDNSLETSTRKTRTTWSTRKAQPHPQSGRVHSSTVAPFTTTMLNEQEIKGDKAYIVLSKRVVLAVAVGVSVVLIFMMAFIVALIGRQAFRSQSGQIERNITCLDSTDEGFTSFAAHLNHDYERTITRTQDSTSTDVEVGALTYPINILPLPHRSTPPSSHDYEEVEGHPVDTLEGDYMLPDVKEGSSDGYLDMVSNVKKGDACGNALPLVTIRHVRKKMTERPISEENGYLVPNVEQYRSRDM
ncbi:uncharacterized protein LOC135153744 [Lytechinus pictus]|uniref:uncharacterized protein LOC135153744 n=1 Tax=Lytechinus pictus TaxID=7653 RepID=UPI0030B9D808